MIKHKANIIVFLAAMTSILSAFEPPVFLAVLTDDSPRLVKLGTLETTGSDLLDIEDGWVSIDPGGCLALIRQDSWKPRPYRMRVTLHDGQVFPGELLSGDQDTIKIDHLWMRELDIPIDRISLIEFRSNKPVPPGQSDRIVLMNGDVLQGFITSINETVTIETDRADSELINVPIQRVAAIAFGGKKSSAPWPQVWTLDGVRMSVEHVAIDPSGRLDLEPHEFMVGGYERMPSSDEVVALVLDGDRFIPMANLPVKTTKTSIARRTDPDPERSDPTAPIGLTDLNLGGPARYEFTLPTGTLQFQTVVQRPRTSKRWPSPTVRVSLEGIVLWEKLIEESVDLDLSFEPTEDESDLIIEISCGSQGPVHCGVQLLQPILLRKPD